MTWQLDDNRPIYAQLIEHLQFQILSGDYPPGGKLPSVRELASEASVNPNTMQKALSELETQGLLCTQRTVGRSVTEDAEAIAQMRRALMEKTIQEFLENMGRIGCSPNETLKMFSKYVEEKN
ncbi:GntR family transcriptional regulator [Acidaminobacterium chupaoyuni]